MAVLYSAHPGAGDDPQPVSDDALDAVQTAATDAVQAATDTMLAATDSVLAATDRVRTATIPFRQALARLGVYLRGDRWFAQLIRFALVGGLSNIGYFLLFLACYGGGPQLANLTGSVVSTALANELHRRLTFHASDRVGWLTAQLEGGGLALVGLGITRRARGAGLPGPGPVRYFGGDRRHRRHRGRRHAAVPDPAPVGVSHRRPC